MSAHFLATQNGSGLVEASRERGRYKNFIAEARRLLGFNDPTKSEICRLAIAAHRRKVGSRQKQARPLRFRGAVKDPVQNTPRGIRIRAILAACDETPTRNPQSSSAFGNLRHRLTDHTDRLEPMI